MFEYLEGLLVELNPTYAVLDTGKTGWYIHITLNTYTLLQGKETARLYIHQVIREDAHLLFGFYERSEREMFRYLIGVSGIGAATARLVLSSMTPAEFRQAVLAADIRLLKTIKGIGQKSAERLVVELKDKLGKTTAVNQLFSSKDNTVREESLSALVTLGFSKASVEKVLDKIMSRDSQTVFTVEELIKQALREM